MRAALALIAVGLLIWGLTTQSDLDSAQKEAQSKEAAGTVASSSKAADEDLEQTPV